MADSCYPVDVAQSTSLLDLLDQTLSIHDDTPVTLAIAATAVATINTLVSAAGGP